MPSLKNLVGTASLAALAAAAPQQLDFAAIQAAPTVASGPIADGPANQTAALPTTFAAPAAVVASASPLSSRKLARRDFFGFIGSSFVDSSTNGKFGKTGVKTTVAAGVNYWINGFSTHNFFGNIDNYGSIYVSQTAALKTNPWAGGQTSDWVGHDVNNGNLNNAKGALIQLNDIGSASAPTHDWYIRSMQNDGTIQWCGRGDTGGSTFQMYCDIDSTNNGLISFEQSKLNLGASFVWRNPTLTSYGAASANLYNNGAFRLVNVVFHNVQNIYGSGCWQLGVGAVLYLEDGTGVFQNPNRGSCLPGQSIAFLDASATLHMDTAVYSYNSNFGAQVYGFGAGNAIEFYEIIKTFSYNGLTGTLSVTFSSRNVVNIKVGTGYIASKFRNGRNPKPYNTYGYNAIFYDAPCPSQQQPSQCGISAPVCSDLGQNPPTDTTSSSSSIAVPTTSSTSSSSSSIVSTTSSSAPATTTSTTSSSVVSTTSSSIVSTTSSSAIISTSSSAPLTTSSYLPTTVPTTTTSYTPYYPALATGYTTDPALAATRTTTAGQPCVTQPEEGTYCGFINPLDPCAPLPDGYGPVPTPDTPEAFLAYKPFHDMANAAPSTIPSTNGSQYVQTFKDLNAASQVQSYLGLVTLQTYDVTKCAAACDANSLCTSFNLFIERSPSLNPSKNDSTAFTVWGYDCPNPPSMTSYKCQMWGSYLDASTATNDGQWREDFHVVITGSDGYDKTNSTTPADPTGPVPSSPSSTSSSSSSAVTSSTSSAAATTSGVITSSATTSGAATTTGATTSGVATTSGTATTASTGTSTTPCATPKPTNPWKHPKPCGGKAIDAPPYSLGGHFFPGPYNPQACSDYALAQHGANVAAGKPGCRMFNAYYLHKNGKPHGTYCGLYNSVLDISVYASFQGSVVGGVSYDVKQSWVFEAAW